MRRFKLETFIIVALLVVSAGCSGQKLPSDMPPLQPTKITVTMDGAPLAGASVSLTPVTGKFTAGGVADEKGVVAPITDGKYDGVPAGKYKVTVTKMLLIPGPTSKLPAPTDPQELAKYKQKIDAETKTMQGVEKSYTQPNTTPLEVDIKEGKNDLPIEVKKA